MNLLRGLVIVLLLVVSTGRADTTWVASGNVSGVWNSSGSPYMVHSGDITVAMGQTLLINPGVKVYFAGQYKLIVNGLLQAIGAESDSIWFTGSSVNFPFDIPQRWRGLRFVNADQDCRLSYCSISYSGAVGAGALSSGGGIYCLNTDLHVDHSHIHHCHAGSQASAGSGCGAYFDQSDVELEYTNITNNSGTLHEDGYGFSTSGGGFATLNTTIHLRHCKVQRNRPGINVGGIRFAAGTVAMLDTCLIDDNQTPDGGWQGIVADTTAVLTMTGTTISNHDFPAPGFTNGMRAIGVTLTMDACTLRNNSASWINPDPNVFDGGAALLIKNPAAAVIRNTVFEDNNGQFGAAVFSNNTMFENCTFLNNTATNGTVCSNGGNTFVDCDFIGNQASLGVGALTYHGDGEGGGIFFNTGVDTVRNCLFRGNFSSVYDGEYGAFQVSNRGGALYCLSGASPYLVNCIFTNNNLNQFDAFGSGSVLYNEGGNPTFEFCTMDNNPASGGELDLGMWGQFIEAGGVIYSYAGTVAIKSCIMSNSVASTGFRFNYAVNADFQHNDFFGISGGNFADNVPPGLGVISTTNANGDACDEFYNIYLDPEYVDVVNGDLHLSDASPCIGAGDPFSTVATDYDGNARPLPSGSVRDIGAFESAVGGALMAVDDLTIASDEDQNDVVLRWNAVGSAQSYQIYSGEAQEYVPGMFTLIGTTADTFFVDDDVLLTPAMQRTYVIRATVLP